MAARALESPGAGARARLVRRRLGLRRRTVAVNAGLSRRELAALERERREMSVEQARWVAGSLGVEVGELLPAIMPEPPPMELRIDDVVTNLAPPDPVPRVDTAPPVERRKLPRARREVERSFAAASSQLDDVRRACARFATCEPEDELRELLADLESAVTRALADPELSNLLAQHRRANEHHAVTRTRSRNSSWRSRISYPYG